MEDLEEVEVHNTDPLLSDTDGDGLNDGQEVDVFGTNALNGDSDGDSFDDAVELEEGTNPMTSKDFPVTSGCACSTQREEPRGFLAFFAMLLGFISLRRRTDS